MKKLMLGVALTFGLAGVASADPIEGVWKTQPDDGAYAHVTVKPCGGAYCGVISQSFKGGSNYNSPANGKQILRNMKAEGGGAYSGKVWRPSNDKIYIGKAQVNGSKMKLSGCVAGGLICAKQTWTKIK